MKSNPIKEEKKFQAEVNQLLDIVIHSLYTDKEIFIRELVSNASDALEKLKHIELTEEKIFNPDLELKITISSDEKEGTVTISDHGLGMTRDELNKNLGTIAHSGSKAFLKALEESKKKDSSLIGQFGVGFYSAFMVASEVTVYTRSWKEDGENLIWNSDGKTGYSIEVSDEELDRGSKIVLKLRDELKDFAKDDTIKRILKNYSSFVSFPILVGEEKVNTIDAVWRKNKSDISEEEYTEFYKFTSNSFDEPMLRMHFSADVPIEIHALLFVPKENMELFGMGKMDPKVSLYCKNVLIDDKPEGILPEWLRFLSGVIDSSDIPLNISRESMQDSSLVRKINSVITKRFLKYLDSESKNNPDKYKNFYSKFGRFLKEGIVVDFSHKENLSKLIRFESSFTKEGENTSFEDYISRSKEGQDKIYYLTGTDRKTIESGPYIEALKERNLEVIYFFDSIDEYLLQHLRDFDGKSLISATSSSLDLKDVENKENDATTSKPLDQKKIDSLCEFIKKELGDKVEKIYSGKRLVKNPIIALMPENSMTPQMRQMMQAMNPNEPLPSAKVELEINPSHNIIHFLSQKIDSNTDLAKLIINQLFDQSLLNAGLLDNHTEFINRGFEIMEKAMESS